jgi:hypothetical protein
MYTSFWSATRSIGRRMGKWVGSSRLGASTWMRFACAAATDRKGRRLGKMPYYKTTYDYISPQITPKIWRKYGQILAMDTRGQCIQCIWIYLIKVNLLRFYRCFLEDFMRRGEVQREPRKLR